MARGGDSGVGVPCSSTTSRNASRFATLIQESRILVKKSCSSFCSACCANFAHCAAMLHAWSLLERMTCLSVVGHPTGDDMSGVVGVCTMRDSAGTILRLHDVALWNEMQCCGLVLEPAVLLLTGDQVMPRYFFNLSFGQRFVRDEEGVDLPSRSAARDEALAAVRDLAKPQIGGNSRRWAGWFLEVADEQGQFFRTP